MSTKAYEMNYLIFNRSTKELFKMIIFYMGRPIVVKAELLLRIELNLDTLIEVILQS